MPSYYIAHSSIPGRQNGVRHGPPYPIPGAIRAAMAARSKENKRAEKTKTKSFSFPFGRKKAEETKNTKVSTASNRPKTKDELYLDNIRRLKNTPIDRMTDEELQLLTNRLGLEAALKSRIDDLNQSAIKSGKENANGFKSKFKNEMSTQVSKLATNVAINFSKNLLKNAFNWEDDMFSNPVGEKKKDDDSKKKSKTSGGMSTV